MATGVLLFPPGFRVVDANGDPVSGALCNVYQSGTTTRTDTYSDATLSTANTNPVESDAAGLFDPIYVDPDASIKVVLTDADAVAIQTVDPWVPPAVGPDAPASEQTTTLTGNQDDFALTDGVTVLRCNNASALTIRGLSGGTAGRRLTILNVGSSTVKLAQQDTNSTAANRIDSPSTAGQIIGADGAIDLAYDDTSDRWRITSVEPGVAITPAFAAGNFTANGSMSWTVASGDVSNCSYQQRGTRVRISMALASTTVGGTVSSTLMIGNGAYGGFTSAALHEQPFIYFDNSSSTPAIGELQINASGTAINLFKASRANWTASTDNTTIHVQMDLQIT